MTLGRAVAATAISFFVVAVCCVAFVIGGMRQDPLGLDQVQVVQVAGSPADTRSSALHFHVWKGAIELSQHGHAGSKFRAAARHTTR